MNEIAELLRKHALGTISDVDLVRALMAAELAVIAKYKSLDDNLITIQDYVMDGQVYIPIFPDGQIAFRRRSESILQNGGSEDTKVVAIKGEKLFDMLPRNQQIFIDAGDELGTTLYVRDIKSMMRKIRSLN